MNEKPIPSAEAVDILARAQYDWVCNVGGGARLSDGTAVAWADLPNSAKPAQQQMSLELLVAAYPTIVADVLHHAADELNLVSATGWAVGDAARAGVRALRKLQRQEESRERVLADELRLTQYGPEAYL